MSGLIYFRFRNALQSEQVAFDGHFITIGELKHLIAVKKGLGREAAAELILSDQNNTIEYNDDKQQLAKMSKVFVRRAPPKSKPLVGATPAPEVPAAKPETTAEASTADDDVFGGDVFADQAAALDAELQRVGAVAEAEARAQAQASVSGIGRGGRGMAGDRGRGRSGAGEGRGGGGGRGTAGPPPTYRCNKCAGFGHWQKDCPANDDPNLEVRRIRNPAGIPVTMLRRNADGSLILPNGEVGGLAPNAKAFEAATAAYRPTPPPMREPTPPPAVTAAAAPPAALPAPVQAPLEPAPPMLALMPPLADFGFPSYSSAAEPPPRRVRSPSPLHQHMGALVNEGVLPFAPPQVLAEAFAGPPLSKEEFERIKALGALPGMPRAGDGGGRHSRSPRRDRRSRSRERRSRSRERRRSRSRERRPASPPLQGAMFYGVRPPRSPVVSRQRSPPRAAAAQRAPFVAPVVEDSRPREPSPEEAMDDTWMY